MTLHLVSLPWTELTKAWEAEAFTARSRVLANMLAKYGRVIVYGGEHHEVRVQEYVPIVDRQWQARHFPGFRTSDVFMDYDPSRAPWIEFDVYAAKAIRERARPGDFLGVTMGVSQQLIVNLLPDLGLTVVEVGVGYKGVIEAHRVYESWAWRFYHAGRAVGMAEARGAPDADTMADVRNFDEVIPRPYEVADFPAGKGDGGYFLFLGRVVARKGPHIASQVCQRLGAKLLVAGQNVTKVEPGRITSSDDTVLEGDVEYVGVVGPEDRAKLMGGAIAVFSPTTYTGPFEGTHAEAMLTGTPVISTDWGVFHENVVQGVTGYRCRTMAEFVDAAKRVGSLDRRSIRDYAVGKFSTEVVGPQYDAYFNRLVSLRTEGWYRQPLERVAA